MSDSKNIPSPPPDDFSKTTPNINLPKDNSPQNAWEKTNHKFPAQPPSDDWGNTVANIRPIEADDHDFNKTYYPGSQKSAQMPDWGMTQANIDLSETDYGVKQDTSGPPRRENIDEGNYGATTPYFRLPEAERAKYQNLPPTPTEKAAQEKKEQKEKGGIPPWIWVSGGLFSMFFFAVAVLFVVYFFFFPNTGFEARVIDAPPGSSVRVDKAPWGVTDENGSIKLPVLRAGETKTIEIIHPTFTCQPATVISNNGVVSPNPIKALCSPTKVDPGDNCTDFKRGEEDRAERCYNAALNLLPDPPPPEDLVKALNIFIINFETNKFDIPLVRLAALKRGAEFIKKLPPTVVLEIGGHTDSQGPDEKNQILSENRAKAVRDQLVKFEVKSEVLQTKGYGETSPKATNDTEDGKFQNRRIQYSVLKK